MPKFMYVFRGGGYATPGLVSPTELQKHLAKWNEWTNGLLAAGKLAGAQPLAHPATGKTIRGRERVVTDGPYAESKDLVSGTVVVEAASLEEATLLARDCPIFEYDGSVEVRTVLDVPGK
ncbi:MAG: YciI family protein [Polyangiales bacterium]